MQGKTFSSAVHLRISAVAIRKPTSWQRLPQSSQAHLTQSSLRWLEKKLLPLHPFTKTFKIFFVHITI